MSAVSGLSGKRVLVTAGGTGIGRTIAELFAGEGANVLICDVDENALNEVEKSSPRIKAQRADVSSEAEVDGLFDAVRKHLGGLDILVNNAGIVGPTADIEDISLADWRRCIEVSLDGSFLCLRQAMKMMKPQNSGCVINMSSSAGIFGYPQRAPYACAKWAIVGLTKTIAMEAGQYNIRVNAIAPGAVEGERIDNVIKAKAETDGKSFDQVRDVFLGQTSMRTFVSADDIANMALFL